ncbi:unnamed protein product [Ilex paraguariensis]|uniref:Uncharacterized protein n=1 Tax=Ilex paraguariensis TaxID=185542 RepID=A0ABC8U083_9AQUA
MEALKAPCSPENAEETLSYAKIPYNMSSVLMKQNISKILKLLFHVKKGVKLQNRRFWT